MSFSHLNEFKKASKLEKKIQEMEAKEEEGNMTEYESKKRKKLPNKYIKANNTNNNNIIIVKLKMCKKV